jgi:hypothetical protein
MKLGKVKITGQFTPVPEDDLYFLQKGGGKIHHVLGVYCITAPMGTAPDIEFYTLCNTQVNAKKILSGEWSLLDEVECRGVTCKTCCKSWSKRCE